MVEPNTASPHAATRQTAQTPLAANAARHPDYIDASPVPLVAAASAGGVKTRRRIGRSAEVWAVRSLSDGTWVATEPQGVEPYTSAVNADDVWPLRPLGRRTRADPFGLDEDRRG